jgi:hypothetical protein
MKARFRRMVGIFGAFAVMASITTGAALAAGQVAASAAVTGNAITADSSPSLIPQNYGDYPGAGYTIPISNWHAGDTITIAVGTASGQLSSSTAYSSDGSGTVTGAVPLTGDIGDGNCQTQMAPILPADTSFGYFGVNQGPYNEGNWFGFSSTDDVAALGFSGSIAPTAVLTPENEISCSTDTDTGGSYQDLVIALTNSSSGSAVLYVGFSASLGTFTTGDTFSLTFDTSFGAATGPTQASGAYWSPVTGVTPLTVASDATVVGQQPTDTHAVNVQRTTDPAAASGDTVAPQPISNFVINDPGDFLPPPDALESTSTTSASNYDFGENITPVVTAAGDVPPAGANGGAVCLLIDNATHNNLVFLPGATWSVAPGASTSGSSGATGGASVVDAGQMLQLPVSASSNGPAVWTASGITVETAPGYHTHPDGPVWAAAYWVQGPITSTSCYDAYGSPEVTASDASPALTDSVPYSEQELGYVQLTTVTELADSVFGATTDATAAQSLEHQFDYAKGECVGNNFPEFRNGGAVFLGRDDTWYDVLGADYPAGADDTGVLLTPVNSLDSNALNAIRLEGVQTVYLLGGVLAQSAANFTQLSQTPSYECGGVTPRYNPAGQPEDLTVIRLGGATLQDTNEILAEFNGAEGIFPTPGAVGAFALPSLFNDTGAGISAQPTSAQISTTENSAILVTDNSFQDAASASAVSYAWPMPLIVTDPTDLTTQALNSLYNDDIDQVFLLGGVDAVNDSVVTTLGNLGFAVLRIAGTDGSDTSTQFAAFTLADGVIPLPLTATSLTALRTVGLGQSNADPNWDRFTARTAGQISYVDDFIVGHVVLMARGDFYADAISGGAVLAVHNGLFRYEDGTISPLILTESPSNLGAPVTKFLNLAGLAISGLNGSTAWNNGDDIATTEYGLEYATGHNNGDLNWNGDLNPSSSVYVIQPIGGPVALTPSLLGTAINSVG